MVKFPFISSKITECIQITFYIIFFAFLFSCNINTIGILNSKNNTESEASITTDISTIKKNTSTHNVFKAQNSKTEEKIALPKGETQAILIRTRDSGKIGHLLLNSITNRIIKYENIKKWNENHPPAINGNTLFINNIEGRAPPYFFLH